VRALEDADNRLWAWGLVGPGARIELWDLIPGDWLAKSRRHSTMADTMDFEQEMRARLARLERQVHYWRRGALIALGLASVVVAGAMLDPPLKELRVKTLRIVDDAGKDRMVLTADPDKADMTFFDPSGKSRLTLDIAKDRRPVLIFAHDSDDKDSDRLTLGLEEEGHPGLILYDSAGRKRVAFGIPKEGGPVIRVLDDKGKLQTRFP
jgi:hypothetical protein